MKLISEKIYKKYKKFWVNEILIWDLVQLTLKKPKERIGFLSTHIIVLRKDPKNTGKIIWKWYWLDSKEEFLFHVDFIYKKYNNLIKNED